MVDWLTIDEFLDAPARERILAGIASAGAVPAEVYGGASTAGVDQRVRSARKVVVEDELRELVRGLLAGAQSSIGNHFGLTLNELEEPQFLRYLPGDFFVAHQDGNTPVIRDDSRHRRVSVVVFLNDAYEGGSFVFHGKYPEWQKRYEVPATPGSLIAFRSETTHEVTPITDGTRYSIVSWYR